MPDALAIGIPYDVFWHLNPKKLKPFQDAYKRKREEMDAMVHIWVGNYFMSALGTVLSHCFNKNSTVKYIEKPIMANLSSNKEELTEEEKQRQVDLFFATENARRVNWKRKHKQKDSDSK